MGLTSGQLLADQAWMLPSATASGDFPGESITVGSNSPILCLVPSATYTNEWEPGGSLSDKRARVLIRRSVYDALSSVPLPGTQVTFRQAIWILRHIRTDHVDSPVTLEIERAGRYDIQPPPAPGSPLVLPQSEDVFGTPAGEPIVIP